MELLALVLALAGVFVVIRTGLQPLTASLVKRTYRDGRVVFIVNGPHHSWTFSDKEDACAKYKSVTILKEEKMRCRD